LTRIEIRKIKRQLVNNSIFQQIKEIDKKKILYKKTFSSESVNK